MKASRILICVGLAALILALMFSLMRFEGSSEALIFGALFLAIGYSIRFINKAQKQVLDVLKWVFVLLYCMSFANLSFFLQFSDGVNKGLTFLLNILLLVILVMSYRKREVQTWIKFVFNKYTAIIAGVGAIAFIFKIMHFKGADILLISFAVLSCIYLVTVAFVDPVRKA